MFQAPATAELPLHGTMVFVVVVVFSQIRISELVAAYGNLHFNIHDNNRCVWQSLKLTVLNCTLNIPYTPLAAVCNTHNELLLPKHRQRKKEKHLWTIILLVCFLVNLATHWTSGYYGTYFILCNSISRCLSHC